MSKPGNSYSAFPGTPPFDLARAVAGPSQRRPGRRKMRPVGNMDHRAETCESLLRIFSPSLQCSGAVAAAHPAPAPATHKPADRRRDVETSVDRSIHWLRRRGCRTAVALIRAAESKQATTRPRPLHFHEARLPTVQLWERKKASLREDSSRNDCEYERRDALPKASRRPIRKNCPLH